MNLAVPANYRLKIKENEKINKYLDLSRELKRQLNMKMMVILIVTGALGTDTKGLEKRLRLTGDLEEESKPRRPHHLKSTRILRRLLETCGDH